VQDFRELNQNSHIDKYSMKEITECIGDIGRANSNIFTTLDLTSGFWQMQLDKDCQKLTAFTIPGKGQFHWITSPMGLLGCPASFQRLVEGVLRDIPNNDLARTNNWNDTTTFANVANTLKGFARDWLFVEMLNWEGDQLTRTNLKPRFQRQFATQLDKKLIDRPPIWP
jgi:Reverse transcriptase (RNA-dependent DNA polymerase)